MSISRYYPRIERVILTEDWYACTWVTGILEAYDIQTKQTYPQGPVEFDQNNSASFTVALYDPGGIITWELIAREDDNGELFVPSGSIVTCWQPEDSPDGHWEPLAFGSPCELSSSESSESESSSEESASGSEESASGSESEEASSIGAERCWIGEPEYGGGLPYHKQPNKIDAPYATCGTIYVGTVTCGLAVDDAGHVIGWWNRTGAWFSPWGYAEPNQAGGVGIAATHQPYET